MNDFVKHTAPAIAIVGMACEYADAHTPQELWENILSQRQAFRRLPAERLSLDDYFAGDHNIPDHIYSTTAALIADYQFDRVGFCVAGSTFRCADLTHWLALDVAARALADAGFADSKTIPYETTGVLLGNTLTGEFSRANSLRLRWPYVRRVVEAQPRVQEMTEADRQTFLQDLETLYKAPFPPIGEESLAGNLSNTIAGRICNHFNLQGGGYTLDGACSSSLLAVAQACSALVAGDLDLVLAGGVDLSLDPFELVGFAKAGALAAEEMRVYDQQSAGFIPGEGCGLVVLMRYDDAIAQKKRIYSVIQGWGISADGQGGITRPEVAGQMLALQRAYRRAGFSCDSVAYFEGHGTGTSVGDATELQALTRARLDAGGVGPAVIGSIKANIGHTKAAAGIAGLIKTAQALYRQILPPTTGCQTPHSLLNKAHSSLKTLRQAEVWPSTMPLRAGVSAMGFGGINTHIVLAGISGDRKTRLTPQERRLMATPQDAELFLFSADDVEVLATQVAHLLTIAPRLSRAEMSDLATTLAKTVVLDLPIRGAIVACNPQQLTNCLEILATKLENQDFSLNPSSNVFLGKSTHPPRIGFLFPGQAAPVYLHGNLWQRRFSTIEDLYNQTQLPIAEDLTATLIAQPSIVTATIAGLRVLSSFGVDAEVGVGHSLGELSALHWAGAIDEAALVRIATVRGQAMTDLGDPTGIMASIAASATQVSSLLHGNKVVIAGYNSPRQTVIAGESAAVKAVMLQAQAQGWKTSQLPVSHAFHSALVAAATQPLATHVTGETFATPHKQIVSTVTGAVLSPQTDWRSLLCQQITSPVRFLDAVKAATPKVDLWIEVGPGQIFSRLVSDITNIPTCAIDAGGASFQGLLTSVGVAFSLGTSIHTHALYEERFTRPFSLDWQPQFFSNPCELAPKGDTGLAISTTPIASLEPPTPVPQTSSTIEYLRQLVALKTELPIAEIKPNSRLLGDLHLNSLSVSQIVIDAARNLGLSPPAAPTDYADATVAEVATAIDELTSISKEKPVEGVPTGVDTWVRTFAVKLVISSLPDITVDKHQDSAWQVICASDYPLATTIKNAFVNCEGTGVVVCLSPHPQEDCIDLLLAGANAIAQMKQADAQAQVRFILVQHGGGGAAFARTLYLENSKVVTCVVDVPIDSPLVGEWIVAEAKAAKGYCEAHYDVQGQRRSPQMQLLSLDAGPVSPKLSPQDVLLVTGGGKGIAAECALSLAKDTGVRLAILGRSQPASDSELANNLARMQTLGIQVKYCCADVTNASAVQASVEQIQQDWGAITAIIHGAGVNTPKPLRMLDKNDFLRTLGPKVRGLEHLLAVIDQESLQLLITFGSIIAETGLPGEADYGLANEWLDRLVKQYQGDHPHCRCLNLQWSIWSGVGMGERLGRIDTLIQRGITPISPDTGVSVLRRLIDSCVPEASVVVTGRFGQLPTVKFPGPQLPFWRFLEQPRVHYPGVELIVDADISIFTDHYLDDHVYQGEQIFPGVMGLEAMAQVVMALLDTTELPRLTKVKFHRPVVVPANSSVKIRIAALRRESGEVDVVLRSEQTAFTTNHFQATCYVEQKQQIPEWRSPINPPLVLAMEHPQQDIYGDILFHRGSFQRLSSYHHLRATECVAEITSTKSMGWFSQYLPQALVLGDPGAKDAAIHALQACIPQATILPTGIDELIIYDADVTTTRFVQAQERQQIGNTFIYDVDVIAADGKLIEHWQGLQLQVIQRRDPNLPWAVSLLAPYLERRLQEVVPTNDWAIAVAQEPATPRQTRSDRVIHKALTSFISFNQKSPPIAIIRRCDGKPELTNGQAVSVAHTENLTLAIIGSAPVGCDVEPISQKTAANWYDLLGSNKFALANTIAQAAEETLDQAATRIWTANECLKKIGAAIDAPLLLDKCGTDGGVWLISGDKLITTFVISVREFDRPLVFALLLQQQLLNRSDRTPVQLAIH